MVIDIFDVYFKTQLIYGGSSSSETYFKTFYCDVENN